jgi:hypothetical protein
MISLAMLYQPIRPPTEVAVTLNQLGSPYPTLQLTYRPNAAVLAGNLLAIGGLKGGAYMREVYMFSPSTNSWINISNLPAPRGFAAVAVLPSTEILVIGGSDGSIVNTVYKGTLNILL